MSIPESLASALGALAAAVSVEPDPGGLPGLNAAEKLINGAAALGMLACAGAFVWGAAQWGLGNRSHNYSQASDGKARMLTSLGGAFAVGAAAAVINFFFDAGQTVRP